MSAEEKTAWKEYISLVSELIDKRENYQKILGKVAATIQEEFGANSLIGFANEIKETSGRKISPNTLRNYAWTYKLIGHLKLPEDLTYTAIQHLASVDNPEKWFEMFTKKGWSSGQLIRAIKTFKGVKEKQKIVICSHCGKENYV